MRWKFTYLLPFASLLLLAACGAEADLGQDRSALSAEAASSGCLGIDDPTDCVEEGCDWLWPGCGDNPAPQMCTEDVDCTSDRDCPSGTVCRTVSIDPCHGSPCQACGMDVNRCVTPEPSHPCLDLGTAEECERHGGCHWFVPGCNDGGDPGAVEGCYPDTDCQWQRCDDGLTCTEVWHDPCWNDVCNACGMQMFMCTP